MINTGTSSPRTYQDTDTSETTMPNVAQGDRNAPSRAANTTLRAANRRRGGRGTSTGQASAVSAVPSSPRSVIAASDSPTNPAQEWW
jgi:hypothetical protein